MVIYALALPFIYYAMSRGYLAQVFSDFCFTLLPALVARRLCTVSATEQEDSHQALRMSRLTCGFSSSASGIRNLSGGGVGCSRRPPSNRRGCGRCTPHVCRRSRANCQNGEELVLDVPRGAGLQVPRVRRAPWLARLLEAMFIDKQEAAVSFSSMEELREKALWLLSNSRSNSANLRSWQKASLCGPSGRGQSRHTIYGLALRPDAYILPPRSRYLAWIAPGAP